MPAGPPVAGNTAPTSATAALQQVMGGAATPGNGMEAAQEQVNAAMQDIRALGQSVQQLVGNFPALAQIGQQMNALLKQAVVTLAQQAQAQTASGLAVPGGGGGQ